MRGHVRKRGSVWYVKVELDRDQATNKRRQKWYSGFLTKKEAEAKLTQVLNEIRTGSYVEPSKTTVATYLRRWLQDYAKANVSGKSFERYAEIIENDLIPGIGSVPLSRLQPLQIQAMYAEQLKNGRKKREGGLSPQTVLHHHRVLRRALSQAVRWNLLIANPADRVDPPRVNAPEIQPIDEVRAAWLIELAQGTRAYLPILLAIFTGMRRGEILALRWMDVDLTGGFADVNRSMEYTKANGVVFKLPKTKKGKRRVSLSRQVIEALIIQKSCQDRHRQLLGSGYKENDLVVCVEDGSPWKPPAFDSTYRQLLKRRKLDGPTFHALRHSHASHLLRNGVSAKVISERLGHSKVGFTLDQYVHLLPGMQEEAALKIEIAMDAAKRKVFDTKRPN